MKLTAPAQAEAVFARLDAGHLLAALRRRARVFAAAAGLIFALVVLITFQLTPLFTATAKVEIDTRKHEVSDIQQVVSGLPPDSTVVDTEVEVLRSRSLADRVVNALKLDDDPEFNVKLRPANPVTGLLGAMGLGPSAGLGGPPSPEQKLKEHEAVVDKVL
ncbi:MAG: Wzz/FepE/Etk N-terminal domain-containing protein [Caulobacteraceae bacterium]